MKSVEKEARLRASALELGRNLFAAFFMTAGLVGCGQGDSTQNAASSAAPAPDEAAHTANAPATARQPNILLIVADDLGQTDLGYYGSEIQTPTLDSLAAEGLVLTNYYVAPLCAPTRSELLSGTDHHLAGQGLMTIGIEGYPGYSGRMNDQVLSVASRLQMNGYQTFMVGKWHLGSRQGQRPASFGFERSFILTDGGSTHYADGVNGLYGSEPAYFDDDVAVESLPEDFYSTDFYTDRALQYLKTRDPDKPFFGYLAYTAPHWPIQAPEASVAPYHGQYDEGYGKLREQRFEAWKAGGWGAPDAELPALPDAYKDWDSLSDDDKARASRIMETYAGMVSHLDRAIGRVIEALRESGQLDNTIIVFQSDNGAEANPGYPGIGGENPDNSLENLGKMGSYPFIGPGWAEAGSAPFRQNKTYTTEGGIRVPAFIYAPGLGVPQGRNDSLLVGYDMTPTFLELAGVDTANPPGFEDRLPITGRSFAPLLQSREFTAQRGESDVVGREHAGHGAIRRGDWKLVWENSMSFFQGRPFREGVANSATDDIIPIEYINEGAPAGEPIGKGGPWRLVNLRDDPAERLDLSEQYPDIKAELLEEWDRYVERYRVIVRSGKAFQGG